MQILATYLLLMRIISITVSILFSVNDRVVNAYA